MTKSHSSMVNAARWIRGEISNNRTAYLNNSSGLNTYSLGRAAYAKFGNYDGDLSLQLCLDMAYNKAVEMEEVL